MELVILDRTKAGKILYSTSRGGDITHIVSICDPDESNGRSRSRPASGLHGHKAKKLILSFEDDVVGEKAPTEDHVKQIIKFAEIIKIDVDEGRSVKLLTHCWAGISRSTAAAFIILTVLLGDSKVAMDHVLAVRPKANPNPLMVSLADGLLGQEDAMMEEMRSRIKPTSHGWF